MASADRRAAARRKAWGRGPAILRLEALEQRQLMTTGVVPIAGQAASIGRPDLVLLAFDTIHNLDRGEPFNAVGQVQNLGNTPAPAGVEVDVYASTTRSLGAGSVYVGTATIDEAIPVGGVATFREVMHAPPVDIPGLGNASSYHFVAKVDPLDRVSELNETNNGGSPLDPSSLVTITPRALPVLSPGVVNVTQGLLSWGSTFALNAQLINNTGATIPAGRARVVLVAEGASLVGPEAFTVAELTLPAIGASQVSQIADTITLPANPPGTLANATRFTVGVIADAGTVEAFLGSSTLQVAPGVPLGYTVKPDLTVASIQPLDTELSWSVPFRVKATVENTGAAASGPLRVMFSLVDANRPDVAPLAISHAVLPGLEPGFTQDILQTIDLAGQIPPGLDLSTVDGRILVRVDPDNAIDEADEQDNQLISTPVILKLLTRDGRSEAPKPGPVTNRPETPAPPPAPVAPPAPAPVRPDPPARRPLPVRPVPRQPVLRPQQPSREEMAERASIRRALLTLRTQQDRLGLRVFRDRAHVTPPNAGPRLPINPPLRPRAS